MKTLLKVFVVLILVTGLGILAAVGWVGYLLYRHSAQVAERMSPGKHGRDMEVRLVARIGEALPSSASPDADVFRPQDVSSFVASGDAPAGWKWIPVTKGAEQQVGVGAQSRFVTRTSDGQMFLLVADTPDMALTHASNVKSWGVREAIPTHSGTDPSVSILLDDAGGGLMADLTSKHVGHMIAVVIGGQIYEIATIRGPIRDAMMISLTGAQQAEAERLSDALLK